MKKNVIALMLVLPLLFVFTVFSSGNVASLGVSVSVNGVEILNSPQNDTLHVDLASYNGDFTLDVKVTPENASDKKVSFVVEEVPGSAFADVSVSEAGVVTAKSTGIARISAVTNDGGYRDSITVNVTSSKPYGMNVSLYGLNSDENLLTPTANGYTAQVTTGTYRYETSLYPEGYGVKAEVQSGFAVIDGNAGTLLLPFSGETVVDFYYDNGAFGVIRKRVTLSVRQSSESGLTVNGEESCTLALEQGSTSCAFYVQAQQSPVVNENAYVQGFSVQQLQQNCYKVAVELSPDATDTVLEVAVGDKTAFVNVVYAEFAFSVRGDVAVTDDSAVVLAGSPVTFYAVAEVAAENVTYQWKGDGLQLDESQDGASCTVTAAQAGSYSLTVTALKNGVAMDIYPVTLSVQAVVPVSSVQFKSVASGLAMQRAVAGYKYSDSVSSLVRNSFTVDFFAYYNGQTVQNALQYMDVEYDEKIADVEISQSGIIVTPKAKGGVTVSVRWKGNASFGTDVGAQVTLLCLPDAVAVSTSDQAFAASKAGLAMVLENDVVLGTAEDGSVYSVEQRKAMMGTMQSTYNTQYYHNVGQAEQAKVNYVLEFRNDVYGNGYSINAMHFTAVKDSSGVSQIFRGPLHFVSYGQVASVAGQDNSAYLVRTDGITLCNVTLLGCSDETLSDGKGGYDLSALNETGTVLEVNADCSIINCRIRNGRNGVRIYGGNRQGNGYFIQSLAQNDGACRHRADVTIEGCIISQAREFLVKIGSNRALQANRGLSSDVNACVEPSLLDASGNPYDVQTNDYLNDKYFYDTYVMTDVTLKDSVLETSGLFSVGIETNFAGTLLYAQQDSIIFEGWPGTGGTSFPSVLRLEGDVRMYDWKDLSLVDSSTLIDSEQSRFKLNISAMLDYVCTNYSGTQYGYEYIIDRKQNVNYVHGGIAFYGGGKNYSQLDISGLDKSLADLSVYPVNLDMLKGAEGETGEQAEFLPVAAGTQDFRFYMYGSRSDNNVDKQLADQASGQKYSGVKPVPFR